jgi:hypothetical protein
MTTIVALIMLCWAAQAQAGEQRIVETDTGITVEYTGTPSADSRPDAVHAAQDREARQAVLKTLASQLVQLRQEAADLQKLTGKESPEELALKKTLAQEKLRQIETCNAEVNRLTGRNPNAPEEVEQQGEEKPTRAPNHRQEKKQQIRELKMLRQTNQPQPGAP